MATPAGGGDKLASLYVEFKAQGDKEFATFLALQKKQLQENTGLANDLTSAFGRMQGALESVGRVGARVFAGGLGLMLGTGGMASSVAIGTLTDSFRLLSMAIGQAFIPQLVAASDYIQRAYHWVQNLSDAQKDQISKWVLWGTVAGGVAMLLPKIVSGLQAGTLAIKAMATAFTVLNISTGGILIALGAVAALVTHLMSSASTGEGPFGKMSESFKSFMAALDPLMKAFGELFQELKPVLEGFGEAVLELAKQIIPVMTKIIEVLTMSIKGWKLIGGAVKEFGEGLAASLGIDPNKTNSGWAAQWMERVKTVGAVTSGASGIIDAVSEAFSGKQPLLRRQNVEMQPRFMSIEGARKEFQLAAAGRTTIEEEILKELRKGNEIAEREFQRREQGGGPKANAGAAAGRPGSAGAGGIFGVLDVLSEAFG